MWFRLNGTKEAQAFAGELAAFILDDLGAISVESDKKFAAKAERTLRKAERRIVDFKAQHSVNWLQRSRAANKFLWALKDRKCPEAYTRTLTEWFVHRL